MASQINNVVLIGASGNLGVPVLKEFLAANAFNVTVLSRESSSSTFPSGVKVVKTDYSPSSLQSAFSGQDAVISLVGNEGFAAQQKIIDAAIAAGVKRFIPSEFGSNTADPRVRALVPIFEGKRKVIEYLISKEKEISWTGLITGPFGDWGLTNGFLGFDIKNHAATIYDKGTVTFSVSTLPQIGKAVIKVLQHPDKTANQYVYVTSLTTTQKELLASFEKATGAKWTVKEVDARTVLKESGEKLKKGDYSGVGGLIIGAVYADFEDGPYGDWNKVPGGRWTEKLGLQEESVDSLVKSVL